MNPLSRGHNYFLTKVKQINYGRSRSSLRNRFKQPSKTTEVKHVVILTQFYSPEPSLFPPAIAKALLRNGYEVSVVTGYPNRPGGRLYPGYRQKFGFSELIDGIKVHRVPLVINHSRKSVERIVNFLSFSFHALTATLKVKKADAVYVYGTPATAAIPAQVWNKLFGIPYVVHVQDLWPESVTDSGMMGTGRINGVARSIMAPWLKKLYGNADELIAISSGMKDLLVQRGNSADRCSIVYNWADETTIKVKPSATFEHQGVRLLYAGNLGPMQDLDTVVAAARLHDHRGNFSLKFAGGGISEDSLREAAADLTRTEFVGRLPRSEITELYYQSDFQLVTLKNIPIFRTTVPSKLQASLASGVPVITTVKGDVAALIEEHGAGIVAEPENARSLAAAFDQALNLSPHERARMGRNARLLYDDLMSYDAGTHAIVSIMDKVTRASAGGQSKTKLLEDIEKG